MDKLARKLQNDINMAKTSCFPRRALHYVNGQINMAKELQAITTAEYLALNNECVRNGINNPEYFDCRGRDTE